MQLVKNDEGAFIVFTEKDREWYKGSEFAFEGKRYVVDSDPTYHALSYDKNQLEVRFKALPL